MNKNLKVIDDIRNTMNKDNLQETISKLHDLVLDWDNEENYILNEFMECFKLGDMIRYEAEEDADENKISNSGDIKKIEDINIDYYYHEYLDDEREEWIINNIKFDEVKEDIEGILDDIEEEIKEAC